MHIKKIREFEKERYTEAQWCKEHQALGVSICHAVLPGIPLCVVPWQRKGNTLYATCVHGMDVEIELEGNAHD